MACRMIASVKDSKLRFSAHDVYFNENGKIYTYCITPLVRKDLTEEQKIELLNNDILKGDDDFPDIFIPLIKTKCDTNKY